MGGAREVNRAKCPSSVCYRSLVFRRLQYRMNSLSRQLGRIALTSSSRTATAACLPTRPSFSSAARFAGPSTSALAARSYSTESSHLGNLSPAPGSSHKVSLSARSISPSRSRNAQTDPLLLGAHSGNVSAEESVPAGVERLVAVTRARVLARVTASPRCTLREVRLPSLEPTPSGASRTRELYLDFSHPSFTQRCCAPSCLEAVG